MAFWPALAGLSAAYGAVTSGQAAGKAARLSRDQLAQQQQLIDAMLPYQKAQAQQWWQTQQGMQPIQQQQMGWLGNLSGLAPGSQLPMQGIDNPQIPTWLRSGLSAPEGSWQRKAADLAYQNLTMPKAQHEYQDIISDIGKGESPEQRFARLYSKMGWTQLPQGYASPQLTVGGGNVTIPGLGEGGAAGGGGMPSWLTPPEISPGLTAALQDWEKPYTAEEITQMYEPYGQTSTQFLGNVIGGREAELRRRGLGGSSAEMGLAPAAEAMYGQLSSQLNAQKIGALREQAERIRGQKVQGLSTLQGLQTARGAEQRGIYDWLGNTVRGQGGALPDVSPYLNTMTNAANLYGQQAQMYGSMQPNLDWLGTLYANQPGGGGGTTQDKSLTGTKTGVSGTFPWGPTPLPTNLQYPYSYSQPANTQNWQNPASWKLNPWGY